MTLAPGTRLGPYEILGLLGAGGMGEVYRAKDPKLGREVALKVLPAEFAADPDRLRRFEHEARTLSALNHPNILTVFDLGSHEGSPFIVMELLEGEALREKLGGKALPSRKATEIALQVAKGLAAAHAQGILHRDLKPENLFLTKDGRVKVLDFGLAKLQSGKIGQESATRPFLSEPGSIVGTSGYMSPEQVQGEPLDARSDLFSLGVVLWEMLTGKRPFHRDSAVETMHAILKDEPPDLDPELKVPPGLLRILDHCLAKEPSARFHSATDLAFALEGLPSSTSGARAVVGTGGWRRRLARPGVTVVLGAGLLLALAGLGWLAHRDRQRPPEYTYKRLTFHSGNLNTARFAPDGSTILYSATWEGRPSDIYQVRLDSLESRALGLPPGTELLAVSSKGELAIRLLKEGKFMLARVPLLGGTPREVMEDVATADWSPDGEQLAVRRRSLGQNSLEYPIGTVLYQTPKTLANLRISPDGDRVAVIEKNPDGDLLLVLGRDGLRQTLSMGGGEMYGLAWTPAGRIVTAWGPTSKALEVWELSLDGGRRRLARGPSSFYFNDCGPGGKLLVEHSSNRQEATLVRGENPEAQDVSWLEACKVSGLSADGGTVVLSDEGDGSGRRGGVWLRKAGGQDPVRLGEGDAVGDLSPDGKWVPVRPRESQAMLSLVPTGSGQSRPIPLGGIAVQYLWWHPKAPRLFVQGLDPRTGERRFYTVDLAGGAPAPLPALDGKHLLFLCPDGSALVFNDSDRTFQRMDLEGMTSKTLPWKLNPDEWPVGASPDGRRLFIANTEQRPFKVDALDIATGRRALHRRVPGPGPDIKGYSGFFVTPDGNSMAFSTLRPLSSDLFLMEASK